MTLLVFVWAMFLCVRMRVCFPSSHELRTPMVSNLLQRKCTLLSS